MADTVDASVIVASLGSQGGPTFLAPDDLGALATPVAFHVAGGAQTLELPSGFGSPLLVDFVVPVPAADPTPLPPTVSGFGAAVDTQEFAPVVVGGLYQS